MPIPSNCNRSSGTSLGTRFRQCPQVGPCARPCAKTQTRGCELLFQTPAAAWRQNRWSIFLSHFLRPREEPGLVCRSFIKSFAIMVVQLMCAVARDMGLQSRSSCRVVKTNDCPGFGQAPLVTPD